jgi:threonine dehydratase
MRLTLDELDEARSIVARHFGPTPCQRWPLLDAEFGSELWLKHENHTPVGAFKIRGGLVYVEHLLRREPDCAGLITATRGNHGQSIGYAARLHGCRCVVLVPKGNSSEKNAAMRALGVELIEHGDDFQEAREQAARIAVEERLHFVPSFHRDLVRGVATYWLEFFEAAPSLDIVYVPIGQGSGICACVAARNALGLATRIIGVVSAHAPCYSLSWEKRALVEAPARTVLADGLACRRPDPESLDVILASVDEILTVTDEDIANAMRLLFSSTHNAVEGGGAASLAGAIQQRELLAERRVGIIVSGGNVDSELFAAVLSSNWNPTTEPEN